MWQNLLFYGTLQPLIFKAKTPVFLTLIGMSRSNISVLPGIMKNSDGQAKILTNQRSEPFPVILL